MKKFTAVLSVIVMMCSFTSCERSGKKEVMEVDIQAEALADAAYKKQSVEIPDEINQIYSGIPYSGGEKIMLLCSGRTTPAFYTANGDLTDITEIEISDFDAGAVYNVDIAEDGRMIELLVHADYGDLPEPDPYSEDYNEELYNSAAEYSLQIHIYDGDGKELSRNIVTDYPGYADKSMSIDEIYTDRKYITAKINGSYELFTVDGNYLHEIEPGEKQSIESVGHDKEGIVFSVKTDDKKIQLRHLDSESGELKDAECSFELEESIQQLMYGNAEYPLFIRTRSKILGVGSKGGIEVLFNCNAAQVNSDRVQFFIRDESGNFTLCENSYSDFSVKVRKYISCDPSELENIPVIEIGVGENEMIFMDMIEDFNESHSEMRVDTKIYKGEDFENPDALSDIENDLISGDIPDLFLTETDGWFKDTDVVGKDIFCDLTQFMEDDDVYCPDNIFPKVYEAMKNEKGEIL